MKQVRRLSPAGTYFISTSAGDKKSLFQNEQFALLFVETIMEYKRAGKFAVHAFVAMPDHIHLLITPTGGVTIEKAVQFVKGGFSFRLKREFGYGGEVWQRGFSDHRIRSEEDYKSHVYYIHQNPVSRRLVGSAEEYRFSSANPEWTVDLWEGMGPN